MCNVQYVPSPERFRFPIAHCSFRAAGSGGLCTKKSRTGSRRVVVPGLNKHAERPAKVLRVDEGLELAEMRRRGSTHVGPGPPHPLGNSGQEFFLGENPLSGQTGRFARLLQLGKVYMRCE